MVSGTEVNIFDVLEHLVTIITIVGFALGWYVTRKERQQAGQHAVDQVNKMATNDLPHIYEESQRTNTFLAEQSKLLMSMDKSLGVLVDRGRRE